ncbi:hypothetical protein AB0D46_13170 [Streptomyces sp. NPDC048383]|uniref:hypothetical protein n=1 Tax=Streptomyces sp. NPDC048383 TaxID=3155386 RepID=UPI003447B834
MAVGHDPGAADAWLGLHAAGLGRGEAVQAMYVRAHAFGAPRARLRTRLLSRFRIGGYVDFRLESSCDLWLAKGAKLLDEERPDEAWQMLSSAPPQPRAGRRRPAGRGDHPAAGPSRGGPHRYRPSPRAVSGGPSVRSRGPRRS